MECWIFNQGSFLNLWGVLDFMKVSLSRKAMPSWDVLGTSSLTFQLCCAHCHTEYFILITSKSTVLILLHFLKDPLSAKVSSTSLWTVFEWQVSVHEATLTQALANIPRPAAVSSFKWCTDWFDASTGLTGFDHGEEEKQREAILASTQFCHVRQYLCLCCS